MSQHAGRPREAAAPRRTEARRLTVGWQESARPPALREHWDRYGPLPAGGGAAGRGARDLADAVTAAGLTGRGGAGFPTGVKMRAVASRRGRAVVVANGVESEPASQKDQALLARAPHLVLDGAVLAARAVGADVVHLCLDSTRTSQLADVEHAIGERLRADLDPTPIVVQQLPPQYVASEETSLVRWINGGEAKPIATPPRPFERGVGRRPTLIVNVETLANVALIARFGPAWFREAGCQDAPGTMLVTVSGAVTSPGVYEIEAGTRVGELLAMSGVTDCGSVLVGGYAGTWHDRLAIDSMPLTAPGLRPVGAAPGAGVLFALPGDDCGIAKAAQVLGYLARQSARQCGPCMFGLPAIANDFAQLTAGRSDRDLMGRLRRRLDAIPGRGACGHPDGAVSMAVSALAAFTADARAHAAGLPCLAGHRRRAAAVTRPAPRNWEGGGWR